MTCVRRRGFTLIEVLMAAFVMAIGVLGLTALFAGAARQQQVSSQSTRSVAHARSAEAYLARRFGPIERIDGQPTLRVVNSIPKNGQGPDETIIQADQWYALPRNEQDGSISVNPEESKNGWKTDSLFSRSEPREVLPKLLFRSRMERADGALVVTGLAGGDKVGKTGLGPLINADYGAPAFDTTMREIRVIADSIKIRVVTRAFPCAGNSGTDERSITTPDDKEIVLIWDGANPVGDKVFLKNGENEIAVVSPSLAKDTDLGTSSGETRITYAYIADIVNGLPDDPGCGAAQHYLVQTNSPPSECDVLEGTPQYLWAANPTGTGDYDLDTTPGSGAAGYDIIEGGTADKKYLYARLRKVDRCNAGFPLYREAFTPGSGEYVLGGPTQPANGVGPAIEVRPARFPTRFVHEIWLDDYRYRAHTLVSLPESVTYTQPTNGSSPRSPQLGYSMLFRRTADSTVQYALFSYSIAPTYPVTADSPERSDDDFFPMEDRKTLEQNRNAPLRLVKGLKLEFDEDLGQYYLLIDPSIGNANDIPGWVATPGQMLLFNGDAAATPPIPGADAPVRIMSMRKSPNQPSWVRAYLDGPPRAGLRALPDFASNKTFDAWVVSPKCTVTQRKPGPMAYAWGLKPVDARIFSVGQ